MDCKEGGGWFLQLHCIHAELQPDWPSAQKELPTTAVTTPIVAGQQQGKSIMLNVLPIVRAARRKGKVFLLLLQQVRKEYRVCWRLCSSRRLREESLCVSSCTCSVVRKLALPPVPCIWTEAGHAFICPDKLGETIPTQVKEVVSKPHVLLPELIAPLSHRSQKKKMRQGNRPYTNLLAQCSVLFTWWGTCLGLLERVCFKAGHLQIFLFLHVAVSSGLSFCTEGNSVQRLWVIGRKKGPEKK